MARMKQYWENKDEKHDLSQGAINKELEYGVEVDEKTEGSTPQTRLRQDPTYREELYKRCQWFDGFDQPASTNAAPSPPQRNHSKFSPKQVYRRIKSRRQVSQTAICSLKAEECEFEFSPAQSQNFSSGNLSSTRMYSVKYNCSGHQRRVAIRERNKSHHRDQRKT